MKANENSTTSTRTPVKHFRRMRIWSIIPYVPFDYRDSTRHLSGSRPRIATSRLGLVMGVALLAGLALASCKSSAGSDIAARVGSREITMKQINSTLNQQLAANGSASASLTGVELAGAQLSVLDGLLQQEVLFQRAQREKLDPDDSKVSQEIEKRKQQASLTEDEFQKKLKQTGLDEASLREQIKVELAISALRDKENARVKAPTDQEIRTYYDNHKDQFIAERGVDLSLIATDPANNGIPNDAIGDAAAEQKIKAIYDQLKAGTSDFATVASLSSEDPATGAAQRGEVGFRSEAQLRQTFPTRPDLPSRLMSMAPGQYTEPIKDNATGRWYIFKVNSRRDQPQNRTFDDVRQQIFDAITQQRQQVLWNAVLMAAMSDSSIKNFLAERIVQTPETMVTMKPSELAAPALLPEQAQPRFENQNRPPTSSTPAAPGSPAKNANR